MTVSRRSTYTNLMYRPRDACAITGLGLSKLYGLIREGQLDARKVGAATLITADSLDAYLASLPRVVRKTGRSDAG